MSLSFQIPTDLGAKIINFELGSNVIFVGANGAGKTRLAVEIESSLGERAHRISAHRALQLNPEVAKISEDIATKGLRYGHASKDYKVDYRFNRRWSSNAATHLLNDYDFLLQALFADQNNKALVTHQKASANTLEKVIPTKLEQLKKVWENLLPTKNLILTGDNIEVQYEDDKYSAADLSDGERSIFYMLGQVLMAPSDSVFIVDEPELHIHPSIQSKLWDEIFALRTDCSYVLITHDLEFAAHRTGQKFFIKRYKKGPIWEIIEVPEDSGFNEEIVTLILGSRRPILFVEGNGESLDSSIYRACFPDWTVIPRGSCEEVIHSVVTMRRNASLTRITCAGIVDSDDYTTEESEAMSNLGVGVLPVSEIENLVLLPSVSRVIAESEGHKKNQVEDLISALQEEVIASAEKSINKTIMQHCRRRIDRVLKKIDLSSANNPIDLQNEYFSRTQSLNIASLAEDSKIRLTKAIQEKDISTILRYVDGKGPFISAAAKHLKSTKKSNFEDWLTRVLKNKSIPKLSEAIRNELPNVQPS